MLDHGEIRWDMFATDLIERPADGTNDRQISDIGRKGTLSTSANIPESVCSKECEAWQYLIQKDPICCWECKNCRNNEIVVNKR